MTRQRRRPRIDPEGFHVVSLGCAKNTVDSASMSAILARGGMRPIDDRRAASVVIVNTCGFIGPARDESIGVLRELAADKADGQLLVAAGCLTQRQGADVVAAVPGIDGVLGTRRWMDVTDVVAKLRRGSRRRTLYHLPESPTVGDEVPGVPRSSTHGRSAYLKIADGCRRPCAFCAIPLIKGPAVSRPLDAIVADARLLRDRGVREINLIAQDTTDYGHDLGLRDGLAMLLEALVRSVPDVDWLRVLYAYPGCVTDRLIDVMASHSQIVAYLDIPLQHAHPATLARMRRPANVEWVHDTVATLRAAMPDIALRSTFIVGYPGESETEFAALLQMLEEIAFDRVGAFEFSFERDTASEPLGDPVAPAVKRSRYETLMALQQRISLRRNQTFVGRTLDVLIEGSGDGVSMGRSYRDAPEIDGLVIVEEELAVGDLLPIQVTGALTYDLVGAPVRQTSSAAPGSPAPEPASPRTGAAGTARIDRDRPPD